MSANTIESIYDSIGGLGKAQFISVGLIYFSKFLTSWSMMQMTFGGIIPDWHCVTEPRPVDGGGWSDPVANATTLNVCEVNGTKCEQFLFDDAISTAIGEWSLVCDLKWVKAMMISVQMAGVMFGASLSGHLSDHFGRKKPLYALMIFHGLANMVTSLSTTWQMFTACRFFCGFGLGGLLVIAYPYCVEQVPLDWRAFVSCLPAWYIGVIVFALAAFLFGDWSKLHLGCAIATLPFLLGWFIVPESPRWLAVHGRVDDAMEALTLMARWNGRELPEEARGIIEEIDCQQKKARTTEGKTYTYFDLFSTRHFAKLTPAFCFLWLSMSVIYYGLAFGVSSLSGNFYLNIVLMSVLTMPTIILSSYFANRFGRRKVVLFFFLFPPMATIACLVLHTQGPIENQGTWINVLSLTAIVCIEGGWAAVSTWGNEVYPTVMRNLAYAAQSSSARVGAMVAPFLIDLDNHVVASYIAVTCLCFLVFVVSLVPPETKGAALMESLVQNHEARVDKQTQRIPLENSNECEMHILVKTPRK